MAWPHQASARGWQPCRRRASLRLIGVAAIAPGGGAPGEERMPLRTLAAAAAALALAGCATSRQETAAAGHQGPPISLATLPTATQIMSADAFEGRAPTT